MNFTGTPTSGYRPLTVKFTDLSTNSPTSWSWDFGDGDSTNATVQNPIHIYNSAGTYTVELTATNGGGSDSEEKEDYITVETPTFSITDSETYGAFTFNLSPYGTLVCDNVSTILNAAGWTQRFYDKDLDATEEDFGTLDAPLNQGLDESMLHYHFGHGSATNGLALVKLVGGQFPLWPQDFLEPIQVANKWDYKNKWVVFDACELVGDQRWKDAMVTTHGLLGFYTNKTPSTQLPVAFFTYAMDEDETIVNAWRDATWEVYDTDIIAAYRFDNAYQRDHDHLPGHGEIAPNEYPDDSNTVYDQWQC